MAAVRGILVRLCVQRLSPCILSNSCQNHSARLLCQPKCSSGFQVLQNNFHSSNRLQGLQEFFDDEDNVGEKEVKVGRPWKKDELRLKSNSDLHKLWYVLLKERNMLMTMEAEYKRQCQLFPSPERFEKVEESMENLLEVVQERDRAVNLLETGESGEPGQRWTYNQLGLGHWKRNREHYIPLYMNKAYKNRVALNGKWQYRFKVLYREKLLNRQFWLNKEQERRKEELRSQFPDAEID